MRSLLWIILCLGLVGRANAQEKEIQLKHYGVADGLSDNTIRCLYFDSKGFLWIGTNEGLNRFDGEEFFHYRKRDKELFGLCGNVITDIVEDSRADLWIATRDGGICRMNRISGEMLKPVLFNDVSGAQVHYVHRLRFGTDSLLYVATDKGLFVSNRDYSRFHMAVKNKVGAFYDVMECEAGMIAAGISTSISVVGPDSLRPLTKEQAKKNGSGYIFNVLFKDLSGVIWGGAWDHHLHRFDAVSGTLTNYDVTGSGTTVYQNEEIYSITEVVSGELWLGMKSGTIWYYRTADGASGQVDISGLQTSTLNGNRIFDMITDPQGRTWIGTDAGLHVYNPLSSKFEVEWLGTSHATVNDFEKIDDAMWVSTLEGVYRKDAQGQTKLPSLDAGNKEAHAIFRQSDGTIWVGTETIVQRWDGATHSFEFPPMTLFENKKSAWGATRISDITTIDYKGDEYLLFNAYGHGCITYSPADGKWALGYANNGATDNLIKQFYTDSRGNLWMLGTLRGLMKYIEPVPGPTGSPVIPWANREEKLCTFNYKCEPYLQPGISPDVTAMLEDKPGSFWVATLGSGLLYFESEKDSLWFSTIKDTPLSVKSLERDKRGVLWMNASGGLYSYNPKSSEWKRFDEDDGIPAAGLSAAIYANDEGSMFVGGNGFYLSFDPLVSLPNNEQPKTLITHLDVMNKFVDSLLQVTNPEIPYSQNFLTFHFTSLCFNDAANCTFRYKLEGLEDDWNENGTLNFVRFNRLPPGKYTFKVVARNSSGLEDSGEAVFSFTILPPFYLEWWFLGLTLFVIGMIAFVLIRNRTAQRKKLEGIRNKIARDLHDDVGSALGSISIYSESAKKALRENNPDATSMVLEKMGSTSREMIENMHDIVWAVNPEHDAMEHVIERMRIHAADIASANDLKLQFEADETLGQVKLTMTERKNLFLIFKESLYNAVKYSGCSTLMVSIAAGPPHNSGHDRRTWRVCLCVRDDGKGFDVEKRLGKGNGLTNMTVRAQEIHAAISIQSVPGQGTEIVVCLP